MIKEFGLRFYQMAPTVNMYAEKVEKGGKSDDDGLSRGAVSAGAPHSTFCPHLKLQSDKDYPKILS